MSKRPHDELLEDLATTENQERPLKKHTLDSDEEDEDVDSKKYNLMDPEEIEGEEDNTITKDGDIQITPFNMKEEMTEGHFDTEGNYFWKKETVIRDAWLDNIDDTKFGGAEEQEDSEDASSGDEADTTLLKDTDRVHILEQMLEMLRPKENVAKALRRLGGNKARHSAAARWRERRAGAGQAETAQAAEDREAMERLTGLADRLLSAGNMEVYQLTREAAAHQLEQLRLPAAARLQPAAGEDAELDMFAEDAEGGAPAVGEAAKPAAGQSTAKAGEAANGAAGKATNGAAGEPADAEGKATGHAGGTGARKTPAEEDEAVSWEFRWEATDSAEVHGPHSSSEMQAWADSGYFSDAVQVRRTGTTNFYPAKRVDFELYM